MGKKKDRRIVRRLADLWFAQQKTATIKQKNEVGLTYISKVLGLGDEVAQRFLRGDLDVYHQVGMRQAGSENYTPDLKGFWAKIQELFPRAYTDEDVSFLVEQGGVEATWCFLSQLDIQLAEKSLVLRALSVNAHAYK